MNLASDSLSKFDSSTAPASTAPAQQQPPPAQQPETHPPPPIPTPSAALATEPATPVVAPSLPPRPSLPSFPSRSCELRRLRPKAAQLKERKRKQRDLRPWRRRRPTSTPPKQKLNWLKPSITWSRLLTRNGSSTNPFSPPLQAVSGRPSKKFVETHRSFINQANNTHCGYNSRAVTRAFCATFCATEMIFNHKRLMYKHL
jgi:hypothetical protein